MGLIRNTLLELCQSFGWYATVGGVVLLLGTSAQADWEKTESTLGWKNGKEQLLWRFNFDSNRGKPFFDPVSAGGIAFTNFKPVDHPWHYGLWFSWKYLNQPDAPHVNYWEEDPTSGSAQGKTTWEKPTIETAADGRAVIRMELAYKSSKGEEDMAELREMVISAPSAEGAYDVEMKMAFKAGKNGAVLDRTPMPGEPRGQVNGGYAGLSIRMAGRPLEMKVVTESGAITEYVNGRARPNSGAVGCNFETREGVDQGGVAIFSDPANVGKGAPPWYIINDDKANQGEGFRFVCASILAPKALSLKSGEMLKLRYRVGISPKAWTDEKLKSEQKKMENGG